MFIKELNEYGYNTYYKVLNAKDFGVPQNRERVYLLIISKELDNGMFEFPEGFDNGKRLKDILEDEVDEKFYVNTPKAQELIQSLIAEGKLPEYDDAGGRKVTMKIEQLGNVCPTKTRDNPNQGRVYSFNGIAPGLNCMSGGNRQPMIIVLDKRSKKCKDRLGKE